MHADLHPMLRSFSSSFNGKIFSVSYVLKVFIKHDSWNEFGEGKVASLPIMILQPPMTVVSQEQVQAPAGWAPTVA